MGFNNTASGQSSHAEGFENRVLEPHHFSHIMGMWGQTLYPGSWHVGNGETNVPALSAVLEGATGNFYIDGTVMSPAADYAEMFETADGAPLEPGYFVTVERDKVRKATSADSYILGVTSGRPSIIGEAHHLNWKGKYEVDEWGRVRYRDVAFPEEKDERGQTTVPAYTRKIPVLNPDFNPAREYTPRSERQEWVAVGLIGKLLLRDDGTCEENGFCRHNGEGFATASTDGYRVLKRTGPKQILILLK